MADEFFVGLGRTTPWEDENDPPTLTGYETEVEELFGLIKSKVSIPSISAKAQIGSGENGIVTIEVTEVGSVGNNYTVEVVDNTGTANVPMSVTFSDTRLIIDLGTDDSGNLDDSQNTAANIANEIDLLPEFSASASGDGTGVLSSAAGPINFTGGEGPFETCIFVKEDPSGSILYRDKRYRKVYTKDAYAEGASSLYFEATVPVNEFPSITEYRQIGLFYGVKRDLTNTTADDEYLDYDGTEADEVSDLGTLYCLSNRKKVERIADKYEKVQLIIQF